MAGGGGDRKEELYEVDLWKMVQAGNVQTENIIYKDKISGSHGGEYEDDSTSVLRFLVW
jgi:hypothetical protein